VGKGSVRLVVIKELSIAFHFIRTIRDDDSNGWIVESLVDNGGSKVNGQENSLRSGRGDSCTRVRSLYCNQTSIIWQG